MPENSPSDDTFGARIQRLRRERNLTQREVASKLGIDFTYLSKLENNRGDTPSEETVRGLARLLAVDEEELLAAAGKLPPALRDRALQDVEFARFLRRLPGISDKQLRDISQQLKIKPPKQ
jgi:transcriptional regulator with XRE-family HTH domain